MIINIDGQEASTDIKKKQKFYDGATTTELKSRISSLYFYKSKFSE